MQLIDAVTEQRWGIILHADSKVVWCELAMDLIAPNGHGGGACFAQPQGHLGVVAADEVLDRVQLRFEAEEEAPKL
ncbi:hypothetical protein AB0H82_00685 [Streptomyces sp. NPDC050732]|uniref:hypothetical protein n=1 Tax=Streptomyces sp. NPDC050732 TaxID=3154632 RepID=UPI0034274892